MLILIGKISDKNTPHHRTGKRRSDCSVASAPCCRRGTSLKGEFVAQQLTTGTDGVHHLTQTLFSPRR